MNRFVVICPEEYDQYAVDVPHAIETALSREDLLDELRTFFVEMVRRWDRSDTHLLDLGGTGLMIGQDQIGAFSHRAVNNIIYEPLRILTTDEWFEEERRM
jgi:hypothetical protein